MYFGGICTLIFFACIISKNTRKAIVKLTNENIVLLGLIGIFISFPIVILHNKWDNFYAIIVSVFAWLGLLKNFSRILNFPSMQKYRNEKLNDDKMFLFYSYIGLFMGICLIVLAFLSNHQ
tara:strand:+ start:70 stop:432 length:363 start_codon:yes stop_codon:yes gene_type:complete